MKKFNLYVHEHVEVDDNIILETQLKTDKVYIAIVYERDQKEGVGIYSIKDVMGKIFAYFDEHPSMEDARPYWPIEYIVSSDYKQSAGKVMEKIIDVLLSKKKIAEPACIHNINEAPFTEGDVTHIQRGKIFPDDE